MILRTKNVAWIFVWVACLIAFIFVFFSSWNIVFKQSRQLLDTSLTSSYLSSFSTSSYHNLDSFSTTRWINRQTFWNLDSFLTASGSMSFFIIFFVELFLNRSLTVASVEAFYAQHLSQHLYLSRFTELLYIHSALSICHFAWHLSRSICPFTSQTSLTHSKLLSQGFFKLFQDFLHLVSF